MHVPNIAGFNVSYVWTNYVVEQCKIDSWIRKDTFPYMEEGNFRARYMASN
jgi:hypothetical protein